MKEASPLFLRTVTLVKAIPKGKILSYGQVASYINAPGCARHISYILSSSSKKYRLPWQRIVGAGGKISQHKNAARQIRLLRSEKIEVEGLSIDIDEYGWRPTKAYLKKLLKDLPQHKPH